MSRIWELSWTFKSHNNSMSNKNNEVWFFIGVRRSDNSFWKQHRYEQPSWTIIGFDGFKSKNDSSWWSAMVLVYFWSWNSWCFSVRHFETYVFLQTSTHQLTTQKNREVDAGFLGSFNLFLPGQGCCRNHAQGWTNMLFSRWRDLFIFFHGLPNINSVRSFRSNAGKTRINHRIPQSST